MSSAVDRTFVGQPPTTFDDGLMMMMVMMAMTTAANQVNDCALSFYVLDGDTRSEEFCACDLMAGSRIGSRWTKPFVWTFVVART